MRANLPEIRVRKIKSTRLLSCNTFIKLHNKLSFNILLKQIMTTMKSFLSVLLLSGIVVFSGCKKDDTPADPRDTFVGEYEMSAKCDNASGKVDLEIEKDPNDAKTLILNSPFFDEFGIDDVEAEIAGNGFEIPETNVRLLQNGVTYNGKMEGEGSMNGKVLTIDFSFSGNIDDACELHGSKE
jgi:hypothetical protein